MKILLDTHILLCAAENKLTSKATRYIEDRMYTLLFSPVSIWEIIIKRGLCRSDFSVDPAFLYNVLLSAGYEELSVTGQHTLLVGALPMLHKDPFDRILLAQAASEGIPFLTADKILSKYPGSIIYMGLAILIMASSQTPTLRGMNPTTLARRIFRIFLFNII